MAFAFPGARFPPRMLNETNIATSSGNQEYDAWLYCRSRAVEQAAPTAVLSLKSKTYRFDPAKYIREQLDWQPWSGTAERPGQQQVLDAYALALRQQHERRDFENGRLQADQLQYWQPGQIIQNWISVDAGHTVGKTCLGAGMVSHFFDNFAPSIIYCFAPTSEQINDLLFKEIRTQREGRGLPGKVLEGVPQINYKPNHFAKGKATNNSHGTGTERAQGQHGEYLMFVLDEAEGIPKFIFDAVSSMASGGICIVLVLRNPRTTVCPAHKIRKQETTANFRISCIDHPNVMQDREIIPGAVRRQYVMDKLDECEVVNEHSPDEYTFELPWQPGIIYRPSLEFLWRIHGIASSKGTDDTFCPPGRFESACARTEPYSGDDPDEAFIGVDAARYGNDKGTLYIRHAGEIWKEDEISKQDSYEYYRIAKKACLKMVGLGVKRIHLRADAGGGYGNFVDNLRRDAELQDTSKLKEFKISEVHFNGAARDQEKYSNTITELYAYAAEAVKVLKIKNPPPKLERDLCERKYTYVIKTSAGKTRLDVKQLVPKEKFKDDYHESPDDGDGFVLACGSRTLFANVAPVAAPPSMTTGSAWDYEGDGYDDE